MYPPGQQPMYPPGQQPMYPQQQMQQMQPGQPQMMQQQNHTVVNNTTIIQEASPESVVMGEQLIWHKQAEPCQVDGCGKTAYGTCDD